MNLGSLTALAIAKAFGPADDERMLSANTLLTRAFVNEAYHKVERVAIWRWSEAQATLLIPAGSHTTTNWPTDVGLVVHVTDAAGIPLRFHDVRQRPAPISEIGEASTYSLWDEEIRIHPAPRRETELALHYYRRWPDLDDATDEPLFPDSWHSILADYAAAHLLLRTPTSGNRELRESQARPWLESFERGVAEMLASPLSQVTADEITAHAIEEGVVQGWGVDW